MAIAPENLGFIAFTLPIEFITIVRRMANILNLDPNIMCQTIFTRSLDRLAGGKQAVMVAEEIEGQIQEPCEHRGTDGGVKFILSDAHEDIIRMTACIMNIAHIEVGRRLFISFWQELVHGAGQRAEPLADTIGRFIH